MIEGLLIVIAFVGGTFYGYWIGKHTEPAKEEKEEEESRSDLARQWWNIMAYDGTERGQIGEDDDT